MTPGTVLGDKYQLISILGEGGMGTVWRGEHLSLGAPVAVKLLQTREASSLEARARFDAEAKVAASLRSPHVVQVFDFGFDAASGVPFIVMELLEGESLRERLLRGPLGPSDVANIVTHVARALTRAHERGVVHRDLKPANIFLVQDRDGAIAKVLDFGIAKQGSLTLRRGLTTTGTLLGTPWYMSPEQIISSKSVDYSADLWSLAVIAVECLTARLPFDSDNIAGLALAISSGRSTPPSELGSVPRGLDAWFARATHADTNARFASAVELAAALRDVCGDAEEPRAASLMPASLAAAPASLAPSASPALPETVRDAREAPGVDSSSHPPVVGRTAPKQGLRLLKWSFSGGAAMLALLLAALGFSELIAPGSVPPPPISPPSGPLPSSAATPSASSVPPRTHTKSSEPSATPSPSTSAEAPRSPLIAPLIEAPHDAGASASRAEVAPTPARGARVPEAAVAKASEARAVDCRQPFWIDQNGIRRLVPGCLPGSGAEVKAAQLPSASTPSPAPTPAPVPSLAERSSAATPSRTPTATEPTPPPATPATDAPEITAAVASALGEAAQRATACRPRGGPTGEGRVRVVFSPDGKVASFEMLTARFRDTITASCIGIIFRRVQVPAFEGEPKAYLKTFSVPAATDDTVPPAPDTSEDCSPPWSVDAKGIRRLKPGCLN